MSFVEFADLARYSDRSTQEVFVVDLLIDVVIGERYDAVSKTSALITLAMAAPGLALTPADRALRALLPIAAGATLESARDLI